MTLVVMYDVWIKLNFDRQVHYMSTRPLHILHQFFQEPSLSFELAKKKCKEHVLIPENFSCVELVAGVAGEFIQF